MFKKTIFYLMVINMLTFPTLATEVKKTNSPKSFKISKIPKNKKQKIISTAKEFLGVKYKYGGETKKGIDCSGFVQNAFKKYIKLPRTAKEMFSEGSKVKKDNLLAGDLVFFSDSNRPIGHVGIYIGDDMFIHASSGAKKVTITNINKVYYIEHYKGARRI